MTPVRKKTAENTRNVRKKQVPPAASETGEATPISTEAAPGKPKQHFLIVGIGASAGGLAAFEAFFSGMPADTDPGMAFVLVQHLAPDHKSILTELIQRYTRMEVFEVEDGVKVKPNCTYIIPPNRDMAFLNGTLQLLEPAAPRGRRLSIDFFFRSLAQDQRERAIGIVLSGTGSDGTQGIRAIKGEGGMAMVQSPDSAEHDGMPRSAISTGLVDYQLPPAEMPAQLMAYAAHHTFAKPVRPAQGMSLSAENEVKKIFIQLRSQTGHDFSLYKPSTIQRRIERRMAVHQIKTIESYARYLQQTPAEVESLFRDLLIGVTNFFRDPDAFKALEEIVIQKIFAEKPANGLIRVWVPGCSTGEEAYSLAILLEEGLEARQRNYRVQIFATDIDSQAIATARAGLYPAGIAADISPKRLARFFTPEPDGNAYRIHKGIRDMLVFSEQDVIKDPPFSKVDLISCRNLLIYMSGVLQKKLIPLFHYALNPGGWLFLGNSETVGEFADLFSGLDRKSKLYQRQSNIQGRPRAHLGRLLVPTAGLETTRRPLASKAASPPTPSLRQLTEECLLRQVAPAAALVNRRGDILYLHGRTGTYLELAPGEAGANNILKMAREGLRGKLTDALHQAVKTGKIVHHPGLRVKINGGFTAVNLTVRQAAGTATGEPNPPLYLIILEEVPGVDPGAGDRQENAMPGIPAPNAEAAIAALRQELRLKEECLQSAYEELEISSEELNSSNEEMQSINEELQSTNEELETSKEELQSINEELATINAELQTKVAELSRANNDMNNLLAGTGIGTIFVDHQLHILRFTPEATRIINLILSDVGRPVAHIVSKLVGYDSLAADTRAVLDSLVPKVLDVKTTEGKWYTMRIQPYRTIDDVIEGAVLTFSDITDLKRKQEELNEARHQLRLAVVVSDAYDAVTVHDLKGNITAWNRAADLLYGWREPEALEMNVREFIPEDLRKDESAKLLQISKAEILTPYHTKRITKNGDVINVCITATALADRDGEIYAVATTERPQVPKRERRI